MLQSLTEGSATWACGAAQGDTCRLALPEQCPDGQYCPVDYNGLARGVSTATCRALPVPGEPCAYRPLLGTILAQCAPYARCDNGRCNALGEVGAFCDDDEQCYTGYCASFQCARSHTCP
jgi:hypothetical protein